MLELSEDERRALAIIALKTEVRQEKYGAAHQFNWKKVGLSRAYYKSVAVTEQSMPTARAAAAFRFLLANNRYYSLYHGYHQNLLRTLASLNISSYDLFIVHKGCSVFVSLQATFKLHNTVIEYVNKLCLCMIMCVSICHSNLLQLNTFFLYGLLIYHKNTIYETKTWSYIVFY